MPLRGILSAAVAVQVGMLNSRQECFGVGFFEGEGDAEVAELCFIIGFSSDKGEFDGGELRWVGSVVGLWWKGGEHMYFVLL